MFVGKESGEQWIIECINLRLSTDINKGHSLASWLHSERYCIGKRSAIDNYSKQERFDLIYIYVEAKCRVHKRSYMAVERTICQSQIAFIVHENN